MADGEACFRARFDDLLRDVGLHSNELAAQALNGPLAWSRREGSGPLTKQQIARWRTGKSTPEADTLCALADYFGVTVDYLLGRSNDSVPAFAIHLTRHVVARCAMQTGERADFLESDPRALLNALTDHAVATYVRERAESERARLLRQPLNRLAQNARDGKEKAQNPAARAREISADVAQVIERAGAAYPPRTIPIAPAFEVERSTRVANKKPVRH